MKIDLDSDIEIVKKKIKISRFFYISFIVLLLISNLIFILSTNYFSKNLFMIICSIVDIILVALIFITITFFTIRYKRIYYFIGITSTFEEIKIKGKVISVSNAYTYQNGIKVRDITIENENGEKRTIIFIHDLYNFNFIINTSYFLYIRNNVIVEVEND